jgi:hypothetical protein
VRCRQCHVSRHSGVSSPLRDELLDRTEGPQPSA